MKIVCRDCILIGTWLLYLPATTYSAIISRWALTGSISSSLCSSLISELFNFTANHFANSTSLLCLPLSTVCIADSGSPNGGTVVQDAPTDSFVSHWEIFWMTALLTRKQFFGGLCAFLVSLWCYHMFSAVKHTIKIGTASTLTLDCMVIFELLIVTCGSNLRTQRPHISQPIIWVLLILSTRVKYSCSVIKSRNFSTCGWVVAFNLWLVKFVSSA